jgi:hypothetical protein
MAEVVGNVEAAAPVPAAAKAPKEKKDKKSGSAAGADGAPLEVNCETRFATNASDAPVHRLCQMTPAPEFLQWRIDLFDKWVEEYKAEIAGEASCDFASPPAPSMSDAFYHSNRTW